ncbi:MAG: thiosulfate oxidation carrier complex protein SoxZ [Gammaproteobacteria bacterium]|nr:thiosulfate oxidation carrier complex protein SoxZ [Gammaproteobacteria bacterium]
MADGILIRSKISNDVTLVRSSMKHPMETGQRKDKKTGKNIPAHFIQIATFEHNGKVVFTANLGPAVSKNPYISFKFKGGKKGDTIKMNWVDNKGKNASSEDTIR